jgi:hypothetical protein
MVIIALLQQIHPKEIICAVVSSALVAAALLHQLYPAVHEGVILPVLVSIIGVDLVLRVIGVDPSRGSPCNAG